MRFREYQASARSTTRRLVLLFVLTIALTVLGVNAALWLAWRLVVVGMFNTPPLFYEANTAITLLFVLGGWWLESLQLQQGGAHVAQWLGGRELTTPRDLAERRLRNVVHEMAIASGLPMPRVFVLDREDTINAFASGWEASDSAITVTQGALLRLTRDELQGVVAHEFGHIQSGDTRLNMRLIGMVFGLQMVFTLGQSLAERKENGQLMALAPLGWALMAAGSIGWLAGRLLKAAVSRQREFLAEAHAVQFTRLAQGLGQALLKVAGQRSQGQRLHHPRAELVSHLLLSSDVWVRGGWLATHPPLAERIRRLLGRVPPDLPAEPVHMADEPDRVALAPLAQGARVQTGAMGTDRGVGRGVAIGVGRGAVCGAAAAAGLVTPLAGRASAGRAGAPCAHAADPLPDCLTLPPWSPPSAIRQAVLAYLVPAPTNPEHLGRAGQAGGVGTARADGQGQASPAQASTLQASPTQTAVWALPPRQRLPWLEHALHRARSLPPDQQARTLREAEALVPPDGRAPLPVWWVLCLIRHTLTPASAATLPSATQPAARFAAATPPAGEATQRPLTLADVAADIWRVSLALGQGLGPWSDTALPTSPEPSEDPVADHRRAHTWATAVMTGLGLALPPANANANANATPTDHGLAALHASLQRLAELGPLQQPALVKQWVGSGATQPLADALRSVCGLMGSPMPPALLACFDALPGDAQARNTAW